MDLFYTVFATYLQNANIFSEIVTCKIQATCERVKQCSLLSYGEEFKFKIVEIFFISNTHIHLEETLISLLFSSESYTSCDSGKYGQVEAQDDRENH